MSAIKVMGVILGKAWRIISAVAAPLLKDKDNMKALEDFADLIMSQYKSLIEQLEQVINDYFELSKKIKEMHEEICTLKEQLLEAASHSCKEAQGCKFVVK
jgi:hypothetical protein